MTRREEISRFEEIKAIVEAVHTRVGIPRTYSHREYVADLAVMRTSAKRKRERQQQEAARIAAFEQHGRADSG